MFVQLYIFFRMSRIAVNQKEEFISELYYRLLFTHCQQLMTAQIFFAI